MSARIELVQPPPGAGRGEMDAPFHAPAPPQAARETLSISIWNADGGRPWWQNPGRRILSSSSWSPEKSLSNKNCFHHHCLKPELLCNFYVSGWNLTGSILIINLKCAEYQGMEEGWILQLTSCPALSAGTSQWHPRPPRPLLSRSLFPAIV